MTSDNQPVGANERRDAPSSTLLGDIIVFWFLVPIVTFVALAIVGRAVGGLGISFSADVALWILINFTATYKMARGGSWQTGAFPRTLRRSLVLALGSAIVPPVVCATVLIVVLYVGCSGGGCDY